MGENLNGEPALPMPLKDVIVKEDSSALGLAVVMHEGGGGGGGMSQVAAVVQENDVPRELVELRKEKQEESRAGLGWQHPDVREAILKDKRQGGTEWKNIMEAAIGPVCIGSGKGKSAIIMGKPERMCKHLRKSYPSALQELKVWRAERNISHVNASPRGFNEFFFILDRLQIPAPFDFVRKRFNYDQHTVGNEENQEHSKASTANLICPPESAKHKRVNPNSEMKSPRKRAKGNDEAGSPAQSNGEMGVSKEELKTFLREAVMEGNRPVLEGINNLVHQIKELGEIIKNSSDKKLGLGET